MMSRWYIGACAIAIAAGTVVGILTIRKAGIVVSPGVCVVREAVLESEPVLADFVVTNGANCDASILAIHRSCTCSSLVDGESSPVEIGTIVHAGQSRKLSVQIATMGRVGPREETVVMDFASGSAVVSRQIRVRFVVLPRWRVSPEIVTILQDDPGTFRQTAVITPLSHHRRLAVATVTPSNPGRIRASLKSSTNGEYAIDIVYQSAAPFVDADEFVKITPHAKAQAPLYLSIRCLASKAECRLVPSELFLSRSEVGAVVRTLHYTYPATISNKANLSVVDSPDWMSTAISPAGENVLAVRLEFPANALFAHPLCVVALSNGDTTFRVPITVLE